jgi:hypothetical protein
MRHAEMETQRHEMEKLAGEEVEPLRLIEEFRAKIDQAEQVKELNREFEKTQVQDFEGMFLPRGPEIHPLPAVLHGE